MRKRLRKKKHLGEYQQLGFEVVGTLAEASRKEDDAFVDRWLRAVEARDLGFGGGIGAGHLGGYIARDRGTCTDEDRAALQAFLANDTFVTAHEVLPLSDAWYPDAVDQSSPRPGRRPAR